MPTKSHNNNNQLVLRQQQQRERWLLPVVLVDHPYDSGAESAIERIIVDANLILQCYIRTNTVFLTVCFLSRFLGAFFELYDTR